MYSQHGLYSEAIDIMEQARQAIRDLYGNGDEFNNELYINILANLAGSYQMTNSYVNYVAVQQECLKCSQKYYGSTHVRTGRSQVYLARGLANLRRYQEAFQDAEDGYKVMESRLGSAHEETIAARSILTFLLEEICN